MRLPLEDITPDDAKEILGELKSFQSTKLFAYITAKRLYRLTENFELILEGDISTEALRFEREALIGETRLWRDFVKEISGNIENEMLDLLGESDDHETTNQTPL